MTKKDEVFGECEASDGRARGRGRVIEDYFPSEAVSERSQVERYQRGRTPHTIFTWWARRPYAAASGVVVSSLIRSGEAGDEVYKKIAAYCREPGERDVEGAIQSLLGAEEQRVLDPFGGGGTLPLEAARLGAQVYALDNNELAHFIQSSLLRFSQVSGLARAVEQAGEALLADLREETEVFFPARDGGERGRRIAYLWTREVRCPGCDGWLSLTRRPWLAWRGERRVFVRRSPDVEGGEFSVEIREEGEPGDGQSAWRGWGIECPFCDHFVERDRVGEVVSEGCRDRLLVSCTSRGRRAGSPKEYWVEGAEVLPDERLLEEAIAADLKKMGAELPEEALPRWSGVTNPALYGMARHVELFNLRQRAVLVRLNRLLGEHFAVWEAELGLEMARGVAAFLSALVDQLVDWNGRLSTWISQNEQVGRGLSGPGMAMVWDYVEIDPLEEAPANLWDKLRRIVQGIEGIPEFERLPVVMSGDARRLPFEDDFFDVVATDPPYFDNIFYSPLADCIYVWKRLALGGIFPEYFSASRTDSSRELTMNRYEHESSSLAADFYSQGMGEFLAECRRVLKPDGVLSLIFAHSTVEGWASLVEGIQRAGLCLVAAWPMYVERQHRPRGMGSRAVNTSFVLVVRHCAELPPDREWEGLVLEIRQAMVEGAEALEVDEIYGPDTRGRTLFGQGVALVTEVGQVMRGGEVVQTQEVIEEIAKIVEELVGPEGWGVRRR